MKQGKMLSILVFAAAAMMTFAGTASATSITSPTGSTLALGSTIHIESEEKAVISSKEILIHNAIAEIKCLSTASFTNNTSNSGAIDSLSFTGCNSPWTVTVNILGSLEVHSSGGYNGTLTSKGTRITAINDSLGVKCVYQTSASGTDIGTITGGSPATLDIVAPLPFVEGSFLCGGNSAMTGAYVTTNAYYID